MKDFVPGWIRLGLEQRGGGHDHSRSAIGALHRAFVQKGPLQRVQVFAACQTLDRGYVLLTDRTDGRKARAPRLAVHQTRASAALAFSATARGTSQVQKFSQHAEEAQARVRVYRVDSAVDAEPGNVGHRDSLRSLQLCHWEAFNSRFRATRLIPSFWEIHLRSLLAPG